MILQIIIELTASIWAFNLPIAEKINPGKKAFLQYFNTLMSIVTRPVVAVREVKGINVPLLMRITLIYYFPKKLICRGNYSTAAFRDRDNYRIYIIIRTRASRGPEILLEGESKAGT